MALNPPTPIRSRAASLTARGLAALSLSLSLALGLAGTPAAAADLAEIKARLAGIEKILKDVE